VSTNLYWNIVEPVKPVGTGSVSLKWIISKKLFGNDGSISNDPITIKYADYSQWLEGLIDGGCNDAKKLLKDLEKYQTLELWTAE